MQIHRERETIPEAITHNCTNGLESTRKERRPILNNVGETVRPNGLDVNAVFLHFA